MPCPYGRNGYGHGETPPLRSGRQRNGHGEIPRLAGLARDDRERVGAEHPPYTSLAALGTGPPLFLLANASKAVRLAAWGVPGGHTGPPLGR